MSNIPGTQPSSQKIYPGSADANSIGVFDMSVNDTSMYGTYSVGEPNLNHHEGVSAFNFFDPDPVLTPDLSAAIPIIVHTLLTGVSSNAGNFLDKVQDHLNGGDF